MHSCFKVTRDIVVSVNVGIGIGFTMNYRCYCHEMCSDPVLRPREKEVKMYCKRILVLESLLGLYIYEYIDDLKRVQDLSRSVCLSKKKTQPFVALMI